MSGQESADTAELKNDQQKNEELLNQKYKKFEKDKSDVASFVKVVESLTKLNFLKVFAQPFLGMNKKGFW